MAKKIGNRLVALSSAAIASIYAVGYLHTQGATQQASAASASRPTAAPQASGAVAQAASADARAAAPTTGANAATRRIIVAASTATPLPLVSSRPVGPQSPSSGSRPVGPQSPSLAPTAVGATTAVVAQALADGSYQGRGSSNFGNVGVTVQVLGGKVNTVDISTCSTYYPCSWISHLPAQVVSRQSADVDLVSGATGSAAAFQQAVSQALQTAGQKKAPATAAKAVTSLYQDGKYVGEGSNRRADVQVTVVVAGGKITSADITNCDTQYPCSLLNGLPAQVVARQSDNVDLISRATLSYSAYRQAVHQALAQAQQG